MHLFTIGFRPFFLGAAWLAPVLLLAWLGHLAGHVPVAGGMVPVYWHAHELLFGFTSAVIAGFCLTAVDNWTGLRPLGPGGLIALFVLWLAARLTLLAPGAFPPTLVAALDLAFLPAVAVVMARVLWRAGNRRNYVFVPLLLAFTALNAAFHADWLGLAPGLAYPALTLTVWLVTLLLAFMGGRVIPFFTERRIAAVRITPRPWLAWGATLTTLAVPLTWLATGRSAALAAVLIVASVLLLVRALTWQPWRTLREPMLWVLHAGYLCLPLGFGLQAASLLGAGVPWSAGVHALTAGALSLLTLGMMARVALGHTGRPMVAPTPVVAAFLLLLAGLALRLAAYAGPTAELQAAAGIAWALAFATYAVTYTPILLRPRADALA